MKNPLLAFIFLLMAGMTTAAAAPLPGSYAPLTSSLVIYDYIETETVLKNGNREVKMTMTPFKLTNAAILAELQRLGRIPAGSLAKWKLYASFDADALRGFVATDGVRAAGLSGVITFYVPTEGFAVAGRYVETGAGALVSGGSTYKLGFDLDVTIGGFTYESKVVATLTDAVAKLPNGTAVWRPVVGRMNVQGISTETFRVVEGGLMIGAGKAVPDLAAVFPGVTFE